MELLEQIVSIISGMVGLGAGAAVAVSHYLGRKRLPAPNGSPPPRLTSYRDETTLARPVGPQNVGLFMKVGAAAFFLPVPLLAWSLNPEVFIWLGMSALYFYISRVARRDRSPTHRSAVLTLEAQFEETMHRCHAALRQLGLRVVAFDLASGEIDARRGRNWRTSGERVVVDVEAVDDSTTRVAIESDVLVSTIHLDFGANRRNVERFVEEVTGARGREARDFSPVARRPGALDRFLAERDDE